MENTDYNIIILKQIINTQINIKFKKLIIIHKEILLKYLLKVCVLVGIYFKINNFIEQLTENNCQDIFSLLNLLLPYYDLNKSGELENLDFLFKNLNNQAIKFESSYYIDHTDPINTTNTTNTETYLIEYFDNTIKSIDNTLLKVSKKLLPNWINVFPYTINNYLDSELFKNLNKLVQNKGFQNSNSLYKYIGEDSSITLNKKEYEKNLLIGYDNLYGCIYNFLYNDIKTIKWMIFDILINGVPIPNIIVLSEEIGIYQIANTKWEQIDSQSQSKIKDKWDKLLSGSDKFPLIRSLILFYLRWEVDLDKLQKKIGINKDDLCYKLLRKSKRDEDEDKEINIDDNIGLPKDFIEEDKLNECVRKIALKIDVEDIYNYIYKCMQRFRYTWYGFVCVDNIHNIFSINNYLKNYKLLYPELNFLSTNKFLITPKNIYNFFKSIINDKSVNKKEYGLISNSFSWDSVDILVQNKFIQKLNTINKNNDWFSISNNIAKMYNLDKQSDANIIFNISEQIKNTMSNSMFARVIIETLIINNMLSYVKSNPKLSNFQNIPDKNKENAKFKQYYKDNVDIQSYSESYSFLSNRKLSSYDKILDSKGDLLSIYQIIKNSSWFMTFGSNWIAQIQVYHHILNQRVMFVTGATGVGKSTTFPFVTLYGHKMLFFNNNVKIVCSQPRVQPAEDNSEYIAKFLGTPFVKDKDNKNNKNKFISQNINYLQYKTKDKFVIDDEYHPTLRFCTDGILFVELKENYLLKKSNSHDKFIKENIYNCILVDEAHEHNPNMDMILTLIRFTTYINNQILLGIVSATMEDDETTYRKYYQMIDDNWKWPLDLKYKDYKELDYNSNQIDRRVHLSPPFFSTNFKIDEIDMIIHNKDLTETNIINLINTILATSPTGDILIFQNGVNEIKKLVELINKKTPETVLALPFYSKLDKKILDDYIKVISNPSIRKLINIKKSIPIDRLLDKDLEPDDKVEPGTYQRFIIVATNIAEASITIDTLKFVIDTGEQKINIYDSSKDISKLEVIPISIPNQKQRKGRVGRVGPGKVYYLYDRTKLGSKVLFKITIENITSLLLTLLTSMDKKLIDDSTDPYLVTNINLIKSLDFLVQQYSYLNDTYTEMLYTNTKLKPYQMIYPYSDGKYDIKTLIDNEGKFYIVHPNELDFNRDIKDDLKILEYNSKYSNKPNKIFELSKLKKYIDKEDRLTSYGELINYIGDLFTSDDESMNSDIKISTLVLDMLSLGFDTDSEIFRQILLFIIFKQSSRNIRFDKIKITDKADFLIKSSIIPISLYSIIQIDKIILKLKEDFSINNINKLIKDELEILSKKIEILQNENIVFILTEYYKYKIIFKIILGTNIQYPNLYKNKFLKKININNNNKYSEKKARLIKTLNDYNLICLLIIKNYPYNVYKKVFDSNFYIEYFNRDVNRVYELKSFKPFKKIIYETNVKHELLNNTVFSLDIEEPNYLKNLIWINNGILQVLKYLIDLKEITNVNLTINRDDILVLYGKNSYKVFEKIDKIIETSNSIN
jgi:hypothetical protein